MITRMTARFHRPHPVVITVSIGFALAFAGTTLAAGHVPTKGPIPPEALVAGQSPNADLAPDFIEAAAQGDGIAGYIPKAYVFSKTGAHGDIPVYASDLKTLVGYMVLGKGYVPLGVDRDTVPDRPFRAGPAGETQP